MPTVRRAVFFNKEVIDRLRKYTKSIYGDRRALSAVIQAAVIQYLDREETNIDKAGKRKR